MQNLARMRAALERRNREITGKVAKLFQDRLGASGPTWEDVVALTPRGNATERHVAYAVLLRLRELAAKQGKPLAELMTACCGTAPPAGGDDATLQIFLRAKLLKAGAPCYVPEDRGRFCFGGGTSQDLPGLRIDSDLPRSGKSGSCRRAEYRGSSRQVGSHGLLRRGSHSPRAIRANAWRRLLFAAQRRWWPVFNGTEHNTPETRPLLDPFALDPEFEPWFRQSTALLLGHQRLVAQGEQGFVDLQGRPTISDAKARFEHFSTAERGTPLAT